jgi:hypothetical protein
MAWRTADMPHALVLGMAGQVADEVGRAVRHGPHTVHGWLPRGTGFSWQSGTRSAAAISSASVCSTVAARPDESQPGCHWSRSLRRRRTLGATARVRSAPVRTGYPGSLSA